MAPAWRLKNLYVSGERWLRLQRGNLARLVTSLRLRIEKKTHHASGKKLWLQRRIRTGYILFLGQMLYRMS